MESIFKCDLTKEPNDVLMRHLVFAIFEAVNPECEPLIFPKLSVEAWKVLDEVEHRMNGAVEIAFHKAEIVKQVQESRDWEKQILDADRCGPDTSYHVGVVKGLDIALWALKTFVSYREAAEEGEGDGEFN